MMHEMFLALKVRYNLRVSPSCISMNPCIQGLWKSKTFPCIPKNSSFLQIMHICKVLPVQNFEILQRLWRIIYITAMQMTLACTADSISYQNPVSVSLSCSLNLKVSFQLANFFHVLSYSKISTNSSPFYSQKQRAHPKTRCRLLIKVVFWRGRGWEWWGRSLSIFLP